MDTRPTAVFPLCSHIKSNGDQCASPALHGMRFCFQHLGGTTSSLLRARSTTVNNADLRLIYPSDRESIQYNLDLVAQALAEGRIDTSIANTYNRIYRTCEQNLHRWEKAHKGETKMPSPADAVGGPFKPAVGLSGEHNTQPSSVGNKLEQPSNEPNSPQTCHPEAEFVAKPTNADEGPASKNSDSSTGAGAPCLEETADAGASSCRVADRGPHEQVFVRGVAVRERVGGETADAIVSGEHNPKRRTLPLLSNEQIERRSQIILKHQDRLDKITQEYQNYPNLTEILTSAMQDILQEAGEEA